MEAVYTYRSNWWGYILKHVLIYVVAFLVISFVIFVPIYDSELSEYEYPYLERLSLKVYNESLIMRYFTWIGDFFTGDWGNSLLGESHYLK
jgi:ABC-type dipeptide/oligopeptide/nickel transport system permease component